VTKVLNAVATIALHLPAFFGLSLDCVFSLELWLNLKILVFGGAGFIGCALTNRWIKSGFAKEIVLADIRKPTVPVPIGTKFVECDVRKAIDVAAIGEGFDWIINLAAVHREPGHLPAEYYGTNVSGAENICMYANKISCDKILFTSSISVYGHSPNGATEVSPTVPISPYGGSKLCAEYIHKNWLQSRAGADARLVIMRPGVIFGPGDPGNILRMYKAVKAGIFLIPGNTGVKKSYGYIDSLLESFEFLINRQEPLLTANFAHPNAESIEALFVEMSVFAGRKSRLVNLPVWPVVAAAHVVQFFTKGKSPIHPVRVRKVGSSTYVEPAALAALGFEFKFPMSKALERWQAEAPEDFV
jgi:GlcNAc-P-P-Und epimerase